MIRKLTYLKLQSALQKKYIYICVFILCFSKTFKTFLNINLIEMQNCVTNLKLNPFKHNISLHFVRFMLKITGTLLKIKVPKGGFVGMT